MESWQIAVIVVVLLVVLSVGWIWMRRQRTQRLTEQYGPEYQRAVESAGGQRAAERELDARQERVKSFEIRALSTSEHDRYLASWKESQAHFVDDPSGAISQADVLVQEVMRARGYPMADFEQRSADISVDHPHMLNEYRAAHNIAERHATGGVETEDLRQAMVYYRALFDDLLETDSAPMEQEPQAEADPVTDDEARPKE
jgi:ABC-type multidrug transport system fused ATPase/permease subunit